MRPNDDRGSGPATPAVEWAAWCYAFFGLVNALVTGSLLVWVVWPWWWQLALVLAVAVTINALRFATLLALYAVLERSSTTRRDRK